MDSSVILVTAVCGDLGSSTARALAREHYHLIGTDMSPYCPVTEYLESFEVLPAASNSIYLESLLAICEAKKVKVVLPLSEPEIIFLNSNRKIFAERNICLALNSEQILSIFSDKYLTMQHISSIGHRIPKTMLVGENREVLTMPFIVKPRRGSGSRGTMVVSDVETRDFLWNHCAEDLIAQELVGSESHEYTTGVFSDGKQMAAITFRRTLALGGYSHEVHLVNDDVQQINSLAFDIASSVDLVGSINIQTRKVGNTHVPFEINPRLSSTVMFRALAGFSDAHWWIQSLLYGKAFTYQPLKGSFTGVRHIIEKVFLKPECAI